MPKRPPSTCLLSLVTGLCLLLPPSAHAQGPAPVSSAVTAPASGPDTPLPEAIRAALERAQLPADSLYAWVAPIQGGEPRLAWQADRLAHPASVMKLITTGAALERLGRSFQWRTTVSIDGGVTRGGSGGTAGGVLSGSLHIQGGGDPRLVVERLWLLLRQVQQAGIDEIRGDIVLDRSAYAIPDMSPAAFDAEPFKPYNVRPDALLINQKSVTLSLRPDPARRVAYVGAEPPLTGWSVTEQVPLLDGPCGDWRAGLQADFGSAQRWRLTGGYPLACGERSWPVAYTDPASFAARAIEAQWRALGGKLRGRVREGRAPVGLAPLFVFTSPYLADVLRDMNLHSNNPIAQHTLLALAQTAGPTGAPPGAGPPAPAAPATWEAARAVVGELLPAAGCGAQELRLDNGSGLSRDERITPRCLGRWLQWAWRQPWMADFYASLPQAGEFTARRALSVAGRAQLKTGSLANVAAIAGLVQGVNGQRWAVVAIVNHPNAGRDGTRQLLDGVLGWAGEQAP